MCGGVTDDELYLETYILHLREPIEDDFSLVRGQSAELSEKWPLPHELRVLQDLVDQIHTTRGRRAQNLAGESRAQIELDARRELVEQGLHQSGRLALLDGLEQLS